MSGDPRTACRETLAQHVGRPSHSMSGDPRTACRETLAACRETLAQRGVDLKAGADGGVTYSPFHQAAQGHPWPESKSFLAGILGSVALTL